MRRPGRHRLCSLAVRGLSVAVVIAATGTVSAVGATARAASSPEPVITLSTPTAGLGDTILVRLEHWPDTVVVVSLCGNEARRGSRDCDLRGAETFKVSSSSPTLAALRLSAPPVGCPCVVRVAQAAGESVARVVPIAVVGVGESLPLYDTPVMKEDLQLRARVRDESSSWPASWATLVAGPVHRSLVVSIRNQSAVATSALRLAVVVGRDRHSGEPVATRTIDEVPAGERVRVVVPFTLPFPVYGDYVVYGTVSGGNVAGTFGAATSNEPWLIELAVPVALLLVAQLIRRKSRARERAREAAQPAGAEPVRPQFEQSSPEVGAHAGERWRSRSYDPRVRLPKQASPDAGVPQRV